MKSCCIIFLSFILFNALSPQHCFAQYEDDQIVMRLIDFRVMNFEKKNAIGKGNYLTKSFFFIHQPMDNTNRIMSSAALRLGYERHNYFNERLSYFGGMDMAAGYELMNVKYSPDYTLDLYGAMGFDIGLSFDITKNFAIGIQSQLWLKWMLPINNIEDQDREAGMVIDSDILSFNLIFKLDGDRKQ